MTQKNNVGVTPSVSGVIKASAREDMKISGFLCGSRQIKYGPGASGWGADRLQLSQHVVRTILALPQEMTTRQPLQSLLD